jgi:uncharacterized alpha-E superfamily protein
MARYVERAENLARILDVNETFARDSQGVQDWRPILQLHSDEASFAKLYRQPDAKSVVRFYIIDRRNPNSIAFCVQAARENARSLRHLISLEMWQQLNVFWNRVSALQARDLNLANLSRLCGEIKEACQLHAGIAEKTMYRDQDWLFYRLGSYIERCDQTTRLVDIKYHALLPRPEAVGTPVDVSQWNALLRSAAAYHGYRRVFPRQMTPASVSRFILFDPHFPRSITSCVGAVRQVLGELLSEEELVSVSFPMHSMNALERLRYPSRTDIEPERMHAFLDAVQLRLIHLTEDIDATFFQTPVRGATQQQSQSA